MKRSVCLGTLVIAAVVTMAARSAFAAAPQAAPQDAQQPVSNGEPAGTAPAEGEATESTAERDQRFAAYMTGSKLVGRFTVLGKEDGEMPKEEYTISKCEKLPEANLFRFTARIRYGDTDTELPMDLPVEWAGNTPVISLSNLWIPGLGTFSSRVLIHEGRYAGTWNHGEVGGHLFGVIRRAEEPQEER